MTAHKHSFAGRVRKAIFDLTQESIKTPDGFTLDGLAKELLLKNRKERRLLSNTLCDLVKAGFIERLDRGVYRWCRQHKPLEKRQVMWSILRMRSRVSIDDLVELAGVSRAYAGEWLQMLAHRRVCRRLDSGMYQLLADTVNMPDDDDNASRLRLIHANKKTMSALSGGAAAIILAVVAIEELNRALETLNSKYETQ